MMRANWKTIRARLATWYQGEYVPPSNDPRSELVFMQGHYERPMLAKMLSRGAAFWLDHWKVLIPMAIGLGGLLIAAMRV